MSQTAPTLEAIRARLLREREATLDELERIRRDRDEYEADFGMGEGDPGIVEREKATLLISQYDHRLTQIDAALAQIDAGTYGLCTSCGEPINPERLEILPFTTLCVTCAGKARSQGGRR
ncbi:MAG: TraR/DksA C4-type zinc finger protein [Ardenticatenaceae bacterium]|nr:TraR/DksA C4-type zinc finger protein [Ardenticatenaceae bacterium]HBY99431.1 conjugal transfer protein TraR [Chloroflexota bacterium]